jgi:hypothetical protein
VQVSELPEREVWWLNDWIPSRRKDWEHKNTKNNTNSYSNNNKNNKNRRNDTLHQQQQKRTRQ